jgi:hypothetical protein
MGFALKEDMRLRENNRGGLVGERLRFLRKLISENFLNRKQEGERKKTIEILESSRNFCVGS